MANLTFDDIKTNTSEFWSNLKNGKPYEIAIVIVVGGIAGLLLFLLYRKNERYKKAVRILNKRMKAAYRRVKRWRR